MVSRGADDAVDETETETRVFLGSQDKVGFFMTSEFIEAVRKTLIRYNSIFS